jgi:hypothetical protein
MHLLKKQYKLQQTRYTDAVNTKKQSEFQHTEAANKLNATKYEMAQLKAIEKNFLKKLENKANNIVDAVYVQIKEIAEQ